MSTKGLSARLVICEQIYYQQGNNQPVSIGKPFSIDLLTDEQPFGPRRMTVGEIWEDVDTGWVKDKASLLHISSSQETRLVIPTKEEQRIDDKKVIQLGIFVPPPPTVSDVWDGVIVPIGECKPGGSIRYSPISGANLKLLRIRCLSGTTQVMITAFPI